MDRDEIDPRGRSEVWRIDDEDDACYDTAGKAVFRGSFRGWISDDSGGGITLRAQILDCELVYTSGMSC